MCKKYMFLHYNPKDSNYLNEDKKMRFIELKILKYNVFKIFL